MATVIAEKKLVGYRSKLHVRPGDTLDFMVHCAGAASYEADLVRILHGEVNAKRGGPGLVVEEIASSFEGTYSGVEQDLRIGSFLHSRLAMRDPVRSLSFAVALYPTLYLERDQTIVDLSDSRGESLATMRLNRRACLEVEIDGVAKALGLSIPLHRWSFVGFSIEGTRVSLFQIPQTQGPADGASRFRDEGSWDLPVPPVLQVRDVTLASRHEDSARPQATFNGRMDSPRLIASVLDSTAAVEWVQRETPPEDDDQILGFWDFSIGMDRRRIQDLGPREAHAEIHHLPTRALRGFRWTGDERDWRHAPREYGAIHFHDDDVYDMEWPPSFSFRVPDELRSGIYAARLRQVRGDHEEVEYLTFIVSPGASAKRAPIALVLPTATYLAYSNERVYLTGPKLFHDIHRGLFPEAVFHEENWAFGHSMYESHSDGSGIHHVSWLRPLWNVRPNSRAWLLPADTNIIYWLERSGFDYDVICDHDLIDRGSEALSGYQTVLTGTHPEYLTSSMYDAYEEYLEQGGRLMYLGGNGFYWRVASSAHWPAAIELRRAEDGTRNWASDPGEYHHAFDGQLGGLWRRNGRPPNRLVGTGFAAQGFMRGRPYTKTESADDPRAAFIFKNVENKTFGDYGRRCKAIVGEEIDCYDVALGSPPHALVIASVDDFELDMILTKEELLYHLPRERQQPVHADLVFFETPAGGAVFSVSTISWTAAFDHNDYDNDVIRITENVLRRFLDPTPFEMPQTESPVIPSKPTERIEDTRLTG